MYNTLKVIMHKTIFSFHVYQRSLNFQKALELISTVKRDDFEQLLVINVKKLQ